MKVMDIKEEVREALEILTIESIKGYANSFGDRGVKINNIECILKLYRKTILSLQDLYQDMAKEDVAK